MNMCTCTSLPIQTTFDSCACLCLSIPACACHFCVACLSLLPVNPLLVLCLCVFLCVYVGLSLSVQ